MDYLSLYLLSIISILIFGICIVTYKKRPKKITTEQISKTKELKHAFRSYFEGFDWDNETVMEAIEPVLIKNFEITNFTIDFTKNETVINITLGRPGLLIGKGGRVIDGVTKHLNKFQPNTRIHIIESKIWN